MLARRRQRDAAAHEQERARREAAFLEAVNRDLAADVLTRGVRVTLDDPLPGDRDKLLSVRIDRAFPTTFIPREDTLADVVDEAVEDLVDTLTSKIGLSVMNHRAPLETEKCLPCGAVRFEDELTACSTCGERVCDACRVNGRPLVDKDGEDDGVDGVYCPDCAEAAP